MATIVGLVRLMEGPLVIIQLFVLSFNERAIQVYGRVGGQVHDVLYVGYLATEFENLETLDKSLAFS